MNRPDAVTVIGQPFSITWLTDEMADHLGRTQVAKQRITVDATLGVDQQRDTLLHELPPVSA